MRTLETGLATACELLESRICGDAGGADRIAFTFLEDGESDPQQITYGALRARAHTIAARLRASAAPGDRVLLLYPSGLDYIAAFFGCLYAGLVAVPALPPTGRRTLPRLLLIARDSGARIALTVDRLLHKYRDGEAAEALSSLEWIATDRLPAAPFAGEPPQRGGSDVAFLQYTSGSTGQPKAVMVTHDNILDNMRLIESAYGVTAADTVVSWLPPYHDMGLIGMILAPLHAGAHAVHFPPAAFLARPRRWLEVISSYNATLSAAPNFAYALCADRISEAEKGSLRLGSMRHFVNGAEPIRTETVDRFLAAFAGCGLRPEAMTPAYGMAEATLYVAANAYRSDGRPAARLRLDKAALEAGAAVASAEGGGATVSVMAVGKAGAGHGIAVVDPLRLTPCGDGGVGEIWVHTRSVAAGYWDKPEESGHTFAAQMAGDHRPYLRTGDLGFIHQGELYITGRLKEVMFVHGRNVYPYDIEQSIERVDPSFRANGCAAFWLEEAEEPGLVIVQELESGRSAISPELVAQVRAALAEEHGIADLKALLLVRPGGIPRTSSGKIQRLRTRELFLADALAPLWQWRAGGAADAALADGAPGLPPASETEQRLAAIWSQLLGGRTPSLADDFIRCGGHSLAAAQLQGLIAEAFGVSLQMAEIFEFPSLGAMAAAIDRKRGGGGAAVQPAPFTLQADPARRGEKFPLTAVQQAYWIGRQALFGLGGVGAHAYQEIRVVDFDAARFAAALRLLIARHEMLRARFTPDGMQQIEAQVPEYQVRELDLRGLDEAARQRALAQIREEMSHRLFAVESWPLFEFRLSHLEPRVSYLHASIDLLICDALSAEIIRRELEQLYHDPAAPLPPLPVSFRDYVLAREAFRESPHYQAAQSYWTARAAQLPPAPELPLRTSPERVTRPQFVRREAQLDGDEWQRLKGLAARIGVTPTVLLLTAFSDVLAAWSRSPHFTLNLTTFNRPVLDQDLAGIVADFTSLTLLEVNCRLGDPFGERARRLQAQLWADLEHAAMGGVEVLRELTRLRGAQQLLMPVVFTSTLGSAEATGASPRQAPGPLGDVVYAVSQTPQVWLDHQIYERNGALSLCWDAVDEIFPPGLPEMMFSAYRSHLAALCAADGAGPADGEPALAAWGRRAHEALNATAAPLSDQLLHQLFDQQAAAHPERTAVIAAGRTLSYGQLQQAARSVAARLAARGAGPGQLVAVVMEKGWEQVVAVLGILYAGAAYLPIDPALPRARLHALLANAGVGVVLTQSAVDERTGWPEAVARERVDAMAFDQALPGAPALPTVAPTELAYVIYTSGSTGQPKGVVIDHRGAVNTVLDINRRFGVTAADRVLAISSLGFDLSVFDLFGTLAAGAAVVIPEQSAALDPAHWLTLMATHRVTLWNSVPALLGLLVDHIEATRAPAPGDLRLAMLSGDWIPLPLPDRIRALWPAAQVISLGGATEASIWSIFFPIAEVAPEWKSIPYGRPLTNQSWYVLDRDLNLRPTWAVGELYIGGVGVAQGYWGDPERTGRSFITHPTLGARLYRTGDLGRLLADGNIEFLGREDSQVKVQGHRIELGEIEAVLLQHPEIHEAAALVVGEAQQEKRLAACLVPKPGATVTEEAMRRFAAERLPRYMVPASIAVVEAIPLSGNGKVDKAALARLTATAAGAPPALTSGDSIEAQLCRTVGQTLGSAIESPDENLLHRGATSIDMVRISNQVHATYGFRPQLERFLIEPTIRNLAAMYRESGGGAPAGSGDAGALAPITGREARRAFLARQPGRRQFDAISRHVPLAAQPLEALAGHFGHYRSSREFAPHPLTADTLAGLLAVLAQSPHHDAPKYLYASAGGAYPVQIYLYAKGGGIEGLAEGAWYYDPKRHCLVLVAEEALDAERVFGYPAIRKIFEDGAFALFFVACRTAIDPLYGEMSGKFCAIEAGSMAQLLRQSGAEQGVGLCGLGVVNEERLASLLRLPEHHQVIYAMAGGMQRAAEGKGPAQPGAGSGKVEEYGEV